MEYFKAEGDEASVSNVLYALNMTYWRYGPRTAHCSGKQVAESRQETSLQGS
jgi:hypothetical protein